MNYPPPVFNRAMKLFLTLLAFASGVLGHAQVLQNSSGTTVLAGSSITGLVLTNGQSTPVTVSNTLTINKTLAGSFTIASGDVNFLTIAASGIGSSDSRVRLWNNVNNKTMDLYGSGDFDLGTGSYAWHSGGGAAIATLASTGAFISSSSVTATNGFSSIATTAAATIDATGWTNTFGINATVYVTSTAVAWTIKNRANATIYTSPVLTATVSVHLQPGWSVNAASGLAGTALPD